MMKFIINYLFLLIIFGSCSQKNTITLNPNDILFKQVNVVPMSTNKLLINKNVVIRDGKIFKILSDEKIIDSQSAFVIDGKGKFLAPGLIDMHAHIPRATSNNNQIEEALFLYLANGVTTIRMMAGFPEHLKMRERIQSGNLLGPKIFLSGPTFDKKSVKSLAVIDSMIRSQKKMGYDFLKIRKGLSLTEFDFLAETALEVDMRFSGHVPVSIGINHAIKSKYASVEHLDGYIEGMISDTLNLDPNKNGYFGFNYIDYPNMSLLNELIHQTKVNNVWNTPTQQLLENWCFSGNSETLSKAPEMKYVNPIRLKNWIKRRDRELLEANYTNSRGEKFLKIRRQIIKALNDNDCGLLAGTDPPQIFIVPGFSLQQEIQSFINAGLTTYDAIKTATINPAIFLNKEGQFGELTEGANSDLVLLSENPLENVENYSYILGVMHHGKWLDKKRITEGLKKIENKYKNN